MIDKVPDSSIALTAPVWRVWLDKLRDAVNNAFGVNQTWQDMTASRTLGTIYKNNTNKVIAAKCTGWSSATSTEITLNAVWNGNQIGQSSQQTGGGNNVFLCQDLLIPPGDTYTFQDSNLNEYSWWELR
jgi:hypothetical protein